MGCRAKETLSELLIIIKWVNSSFQKNRQETLLRTVLIKRHHYNWKREKLQMNGASCKSRNNFIVKAIVLFGLATIAFYVLTEHKAHLLAYSSYIFFLGYILLHFFMCGRHGKHGGHGEQVERCGHGAGKHKHKGEDKRSNRVLARYEDTGHHEHNQERSRWAIFLCLSCWDFCYNVSNIDLNHVPFPVICVQKISRKGGARYSGRIRQRIFPIHGKNSRIYSSLRIIHKNYSCCLKHWLVNRGKLRSWLFSKESVFKNLSLSFLYL